ncbi:metallophosphoesterase family protein [Terasakiella sp. A23]|uniref:metallophosphoesterase family protein n=1 Tax=Terasakiella sp. FCG-A23 TaxID=3080561 RepID=UPI002955483D|nr:metallophosphoesterase family protein [Terasakiella sp. A23]MDV7338235.1 metallophosphoesterase family protein [Terasakiella sp. A23]
MTKLKSNRLRPHYHGKSWLDVPLPREVRDWTHGGVKSIADSDGGKAKLATVLKDLNKTKAWKFPKRRHYFFSDLHGDPEAFAASLVACGGVKKTGEKPCDFVLSEQGKLANFIIGGDCFDKGPSSLGLLRTIQHLKKQGARVRVLAGNHDVRVLFGMVSVGHEQTVESEYFFIRTGQKIIPLLKEIVDEYLSGKQALKGIPSKKECRRRLYPSKGWFDAFPQVAEGRISAPQIERELSRIRKKFDSFEDKCEQAGLSLRQVYAAVEKWKELFLDPKGEFYWFYRRMRLVYRNGSFLFVHAGLDNKIAKFLNEGGEKEMNRAFRAALKASPFDFYYGSMCNTVRTKYRNVDHPFSDKGARHVRRAGISAVIHGHRNLHNGQRIALRRSMINFECDTSLDRHTREKEKVRGRGASVTIIEPKGKILGVSSDYPYIKMFDPELTLKALSAPKKERRKR